MYTYMTVQYHLYTTSNTIFLCFFSWICFQLYYLHLHPHFVGVSVKNQRH